MPYIKQEDREFYDDTIDSFVDHFCNRDQEGHNDVNGHLNYIIYSIIKKYLDDKGMRYSTAQNLIGTLECCKLEVYRRLLGPYEDKAIEKNGDV